MASTQAIPKTKSEPVLPNVNLGDEPQLPVNTSVNADLDARKSSDFGDGGSEHLSSPPLSRNVSMSDLSFNHEEWEVPPENVTFFDVLDNLALPTMLENWQTRLARQTEKVRRQQAKLKSSTANAKGKMLEEWKKRLPSSDEQLDTYRRRMKDSVDRLGSRWNDATAVTAREKLSFIAGVLNVFISGYLVGGYPELFYYWFTAQLLYFMPIRYYTYHKRGYHYFLADMCYFVNFLLLLSIWVAPQSKRLFISTYCLANGNNAVAIAMWRNSMVFHSLDKVTSLFIHIMPCVTLHCLVHLTPKAIQEHRFPGIYAIKYSSVGSKAHYDLRDMVIWSSVPYAMWQLAYHFLITVRRREKIAAGRPTSFTWLRKSYGHSWIGKVVLGLPEQYQEMGFMLVQYLYAVGTMVACPIWFRNRWLSATFLILLFSWSVYNGATYYIDVFGTRFKKELEQLKKDVAQIQNSPGSLNSVDSSAASVKQETGERSKSEGQLDQIPPLNGKEAISTEKDDNTIHGGLRERKQQ